MVESRATKKKKSYKKTEPTRTLEIQSNHFFNHLFYYLKCVYKDLSLYNSVGWHSVTDFNSPNDTEQRNQKV